MPVVKPFKGVVYDRASAGSLTSVVSPPYDIISRPRQSELYRASKYNVVRLELGRIKKSDNKADNRYMRARRQFESWLKGRVLVQDQRDSIYIYSQIYKDGRKVIDRTGFLALMGVDEKRGSRVLPHEKTLAAPKTDRLELMRNVRANLSPIFVLYDDPRHIILHLLRSHSSNKKPMADVVFEGVRHKVWRMDDPAALNKIEGMMLNRDIFIADGHHRYEVSKSYHDEIIRSTAPDSLKASSGFLMVYFVESDESILTVLPAHRIIKDSGGLTRTEALSRLGRYFIISKVDALPILMKKLSGLSSDHGFGMYLENSFYLLKLRSTKESDDSMNGKPREWRDLDVAILHLFIFQRLLGVSDGDDNIDFEKRPEDAVCSAKRGKGRIAFFLNPTKVSQVKKIARLGERMPRKATYFYPKPLTGLIINRHL